MMRSSGILVVNRFEAMRRASQASGLPRRMPALPVTRIDVYRGYRGLDGWPWPEVERLPFEIEDGLADIADWSKVKAYLDELVCRDECDSVFLVRRPVDADHVQASGWFFAGIDVGFYESEYSQYSVIFNEVIFGMYDELRRFADRLNEHLLLPSISDAWELIGERSRLQTQGADLEREPPSMEPITVFIRRPT